MVIGEADQNCATAGYAQYSMLERAGNGHLRTTVSYPGAGHLIKPFYSPHFRSSTFLRLYTKNRVKVIMLWGGKSKWRRILEFLQKNLYQRQDPSVPSEL
ncbi:bile acid-CoA:amino acid N-acyltransferase-like [Salvelinus fontinalis]|uniref:bile acid-CoA:amino acid N-acyltransferase-like n=1 Tax=Salvelinus fontinalis TaxID=8038 RepID=UPI002484D780|nr:bile acid-CoA:amino acid N-acyltransferase-like [Salvelinus fontinalis]